MGTAHVARVSEAHPGRFPRNLPVPRVRFAYPGLYYEFARVALGQMDSRMPYPGFAFEAVM